MSISPTSHRILVDEAVVMTTAYRTVRPENYPVCETFGRHAFDALLNQPDCVAIRIYYGLKEDKTVHAILVGVNSKDEDIVTGGVGGDGDLVFEDATRCPDTCPPASPLNS
ncbi:hypothetical protein [Sediminibacterium soli]|uniref:hypothetical protein n=1 Tax=Sediminibacterium soli TaxID=2698829 RepID=UPI0013794297|nr:hypothetical protein [Sediminibacterium soli]NCI46322.1 hypothetical protein [Sediminibacterium soli]